VVFLRKRVSNRANFLGSTRNFWRNLIPFSGIFGTKKTELQAEKVALRSEKGHFALGTTPFH